jgi:hypothetical protein
MTVDFAAKDIWKQIQKEQPVRVFNWRYRLLGFLGQHLAPNWLSVWLIKTFFISNIPPRELIKAPQPSKGGK